MQEKPLHIVKADTLPWAERAARVLGVAELPPLPTPAMEEWHFTNLRPLAAMPPHRDADFELPEVARVLPVVQGPQVVMVNGVVVPQLTLLEGIADGLTVEWSTTPAPAAESDTLAAWHGAQHMQTVTINATAGESLLHVMQVVAGDEVPTGGTLHIHVANGARLTVVEHLVGTPTSKAWLNDRVQAHIAKGGRLHHVLVQDMPEATMTTRHEQINVADTAAYSRFNLQVGGQLARLESHIRSGQAAHVSSTGLALTNGGQTHDTTLRLTHTDEAPVSHIRQRNILNGDEKSGGHAVFQGKFYVAQKAQKTDAYMLCESLLLTEGARVSTKPELEIYADDVKCSHGASTGSLQPEQVFYLAARGIPEAEAKRLLVAAFADELVAEVPDAARDLVAARVQGWLHEWSHGKPLVEEETEIDTEWLDG